jgi:hypothetical protein
MANDSKIRTTGHGLPLTVARMERSGSLPPASWRPRPHPLTQVGGLMLGYLAACAAEADER